MCIRDSGTVKPSREDDIITTNLSRALNAVGIMLDDHIIVCGDSFSSYNESGLFRSTFRWVCGYVNKKLFLFCNKIAFPAMGWIDENPDFRWYLRKNRVLKSLLKMLITIWKIIWWNNYVTFKRCSRLRIFGEPVYWHGEYMRNRDGVCVVLPKIFFVGFVSIRLVFICAARIFVIDFSRSLW